MDSREIIMKKQITDLLTIFKKHAIQAQEDKNDAFMSPLMFSIEITPEIELTYGFGTKVIYVIKYQNGKACFRSNDPIECLIDYIQKGLMTITDLEKELFKLT